MNSKKPGRRRVGIDLGVRSIKVAVADSGAVVLIGHFEDLGEIDPFSSENDVLIHWLKMFVEENGLVGARTIVGMPGDRFFILPVRVSGEGSAKKFTAALSDNAELRQCIPFNDPVFDWWEAEGRRSRGLEGCLWIAASSRREVETRLRAVSSTGLAPAVVEPDLAGLARVLPRQPEAGNVIVDIGGIGTNIGFVSDERLLFLHPIGIGVLSMVQPIAHELGIDDLQAFERARQHALGHCSDPVIEQILEPIYRRFWGEIRRAISIYADPAGLPAERTITLIGGGAALLPPKDTLADETYPIRPIEVRPGIVRDLEIKGMGCSEEENRLERYAEVMGLSLREDREANGTNFLPYAPRAMAADWRLLLRSKPLAAAAAILFLTLGLHLWLGRCQSEMERSLLAQERQVQAQQELQVEAERIEAAMKKTAAGLALAEKLRQLNRIYPEAVLEVGRAVSRGLQISRIDIQPASREADPAGEKGGDSSNPPASPRIAIFGTSDHSKVLLNFLNSLRGSTVLENASIKWMRADSEQNRGKVQFQIDAGARILQDESP